METFIGSYELDMYGYISLTNVKYVILKNEIKTSLMGGKPSDRIITDTFRDLQNYHTSMILNPFYTAEDHGIFQLKPTGQPKFARDLKPGTASELVTLATSHPSSIAAIGLVGLVNEAELHQTNPIFKNAKSFPVEELTEAGESELDMKNHNYDCLHTFTRKVDKVIEKGEK